MNGSRRDRLGPIDHVAIVVRSIEASLPRYQHLFGLEPIGQPVEMPTQGVRLVFLASGPDPAARIDQEPRVACSDGRRGSRMLRIGARHARAEHDQSEAKQ